VSSEPASPWSWSLVLTLLLALICGVHYSRGSHDPWALAVVSLVLTLLWGLLGRHVPRGETPALAVVLALGFSIGMVWHFMAHDPMIFAIDRQRKRYLLLAAASLGMMTCHWALPRRRTVTPLFVGSLAMYAAFLVLQMLRSPTPIIDGFVLNTEAAQALLRGEFIYGRRYTDIYQVWGWPGFGYEIRYIYLPGLAMHYVPAVALGLDIRWVNLLAMTCAFGLFASCVGRARADGWRPRPVTAAAALVMFWFHAGQMFMLEQAWPEGLVLLYVCLALWAWRRSAVLTAAGLIAALTLKQTAWFCAPFVFGLAARERRWGLLAAVAAGVTAVVGPFFFSDPAAFFSDVVVDLWAKPPRWDSLSWSAVCLHYCRPLFTWTYPVSFIAYLLAVGLFWGRVRRLSGEEAVLETVKWMAIGLLGLFLFLKQSFFNYYYVVEGLLAFYVCLAAGGFALDRYVPDGHDDNEGAGTRG
jgi:hypothetical protein